MLSPKNYEFDQTSKAKVPFSWELKPGISRRRNKSGRDQVQCKLTPPPCPHAEYSEEVLQSPLVVCPFTPTNSRSSLSSFRKKDVDPFLEAYRKCLENSPIRISSSMGRNVRADHQDCYAKDKKKSLLCGYGVNTLANLVLMAGVRSLDSVDPRRDLIPPSKHILI
ncbi:hypothetical protein Bca52824_062269 [Brassica carinata]|uniref:Uncharacterized protein n=1 Tax=Brassica carinata TaxID=52824 RepID=A0A8X7QHQ1_BRACI|nr:hypothetical protein Bca52824_062269 [Brassica carinata]